MCGSVPLYRVYNPDAKDEGKSKSKSKAKEPSDSDDDDIEAGMLNEEIPKGYTLDEDGVLDYDREDEYHLNMGQMSDELEAKMEKLAAGWSESYH